MTMFHLPGDLPLCLSAVVALVLIDVLIYSGVKIRCVCRRLISHLCSPCVSRSNFPSSALGLRRNTHSKTRQQRGGVAAKRRRP